MEYVLHPDPHGPHPVDGWPGNPWIYQVRPTPGHWGGPGPGQGQGRRGAGGLLRGLSVHGGDCSLRGYGQDTSAPSLRLCRAPARPPPLPPSYYAVVHKSVPAPAFHLQNTYVDMAHFGPYIDTAMRVAGIQPVANPIPVMLN
jgi:hypothetical protein